jgi:chemotaxis protein CheD
MLELEGTVTEVYLNPGELYLARKPAVIRTILGSCVGVTFWSQKLGVGALCHCLLPRIPSEISKLSVAARHRYVDFCIRDLARQFDHLGASRNEVEVKLFGGADVLPVNSQPNARTTVGKLNASTATEVVGAEGFAVAASSLGGTSGLNIRFYTTTGRVLLRRLPRVIAEEAEELAHE